MRVAAGLAFASPCRCGHPGRNQMVLYYYCVKILIVESPPTRLVPQITFQASLVGARIRGGAKVLGSLGWAPPITFAPIDVSSAEPPIPKSCTPRKLFIERTPPNLVSENFEKGCSGHGLAHSTIYSLALKPTTSVVAPAVCVPIQSRGPTKAACCRQKPQERCHFQSFRPHYKSYQ